MEKIKLWYITNYTPITWFIIGFMIADALAALGNGRLVEALISIAIAGLNYILWQRQ